MPHVQRLADSIELIVVGAMGLTAQALANATTGVEVTFSQWRVLLVIGESEDGVRVGKVAERVSVTTPATGRLLWRLSQRGLITLTGDEDDGRATRARLTPLGEQIRADVIDYRRRALQSLAKGIPAADREELTRAAATISAEFSRFI